MQIKVASLNFSGINISPFEYYDGSAEKIQLNNSFRSLMQKYSKDYFTDSNRLAKLDKNFQRNRYTLLYRSDVGVVRGKLLNKQQFQAIWDLNYQTKYEKDENCTEQDTLQSLKYLDKLKMFDCLLYETFLESVYGNIDWNNIKNYDPILFKQKLIKWHSKAYLKLSQKVKLLIQYIQKRNLDILCIQEAQINQISSSIPQQYSFVFAQKSMIVYKKTLFIEDSNLEDFSSKFHHQLNFNKDSCYIKFKDYLLISSHLSSKKIRVQQAQNMKHVLSEIVSDYPKIKVILGIDANQFIKQIDELNIFPLTQHNFTTRKRRTDMQLQFQKAGIIVQDVKDHIITNLKFLQTKVQTVKCDQIGNELLPNQNHPFDHFAVFSCLQNIDVKRKRRNTIVIQPIQRASQLSLRRIVTLNVQQTKPVIQQKNQTKFPLQIPSLVFKSKLSQRNSILEQFLKSKQQQKLSNNYYQFGLLQFKNVKVNRQKTRQKKRSNQFLKQILLKNSAKTDRVIEKEQTLLKTQRKHMFIPKRILKDNLKNCA